MGRPVAMTWAIAVLVAIGLAPAARAGGCDADTNADLAIDVTDLVNVILDWDTDGSGHGGDVDGSGLVDVGDLVAVILGWGPCGFPECPGLGDCYVSNGTPGCATESCCNQVCADDPFCCDTEWDSFCVEGALEICGQCGDPGAGGCFVANGTIGCNDADCCATVCAVDPFCCNVEWDAVCVDGAADDCNVLDCDDPALCQAPDHIGAEASDGATATQADDFVMDTSDRAVITGLCWWGTYFMAPFTNCPAGPDDFIVNYYAAAADGAPGALLASYSQDFGTLTVSAPSPTGIMIGGIATEYRHTAAHAPLLLSPGFRYWVEIVNAGPDQPGCQWLWATSGDGDGVGARTASGGPFITTGVDLAFCLNVPIGGLPADACPLGCGPGATAEGEACGADANGGCNSDPPVFTPAACGDVFCGSAWATGGQRDTDWYLVDHPGGVLEATVTSQLPLTCFIIDGIDTCAPFVVGAIGCSDACGTAAAASAPLGAGQYVVFVAPGDCAGDPVLDGHPCGTGNAYVLTIDCIPTGGCCLPSGTCTGQTEADCLAAGGTYFGDGAACPQIGACCTGFGCEDVSLFSCIVMGGTFIGTCSSCATYDCGNCTPGIGACCFAGGTCQDGLNEGQCFLSGGQWQGDCTTCEQHCGL